MYKTSLYNFGSIQNPVSWIKLSSKGLTHFIKFLCLAAIKMPKTPIIESPDLVAIFLPNLSSIISRFAFSSIAKAIASDSP